MGTPSRVVKTFSIEKEVMSEVERTKGKGSASARVNELLKRALEKERSRSLELEAAAFFRDLDDDESRQAFQKAAVRAISRDEPK